MDNNKIIKNYSGKNVARYEQARRNNPKWRFEDETLIKVLEITKNNISSLIDAPVGTGRFFPLYKKLLTNVKIYCFDYSEDMLYNASKKIGFLKKRIYTFSKHDLVSNELPIQAELTVCFRFLNLLEWSYAKQALSHILMASTIYSVFTIRTINTNDAAVKKIEDKIFLHYKNDVLEVLYKYGFEIKEEYFFNDTKGGQYSTVFCQRKDINA